MTLLVAGTAASAPPTITARTEGLERRDGFVPFYWDASSGRVLLEIRRFEDSFLYGTGVSGGAGTTAADLDRSRLDDLRLCRFERVGPRVLLVQEHTGFRSASSRQEDLRAVEDSFADSVLAAFDVAAEEDGRVLIDATDFLLQAPSIGQALSERGSWSQDLSRSVPSPDRSGAFPQNTEIEVRVTFRSADQGHPLTPVLADSGTMTLRLHHSFIELPEPGYSPREMDPRVGFFTQQHLDFARPFTQPLQRHVVCRWRLARQEPHAERTKPVRPIVLHLDPAIHEPERRAIKEGLLSWNRAFEEAGLQDAIEVRDLPPGASFMDVRYSGVTWVHRSEPNASYGQIRVDPRTGEILHAVARIDSQFQRHAWKMRQILSGADARSRSAYNSLAFVGISNILLAREPAQAQKFVLSHLRYVAAHEAGHLLGLSHNMAGSTFAGSVMDYLEPEVTVKDDRVEIGEAYPREVGAYDRLAIRWGYSSERTPEHLDAVIRAAYGAGVVLPLDSDPRCGAYDSGSDPIDWAQKARRVRHLLLERWSVGQVQAGRPVHDAVDSFLVAYHYHRAALRVATSYIGGQYQTNAIAGDGQVPASWVPATLQRQALAEVLAALATEELDVPDEISLSLVPPPSNVGYTIEHPETGAAFSPLSAARDLSRDIVGDLLDPQRAARLTLASGSDALTFDELLRQLVASVWGATPGAGKRSRALQRVTQLVVLEKILELAGSATAPAEPRAAALGALVRLADDIRASTPDDAITQDHLRFTAREIDRFVAHR